MSWRAVVQCDLADFHLDRVRILLAENRDGKQCMALPVEMAMGPPADPMVVSDTPVEPFLTLPEEAATALFNALARHFVGTDNVDRLRRELQAERARVDALIAGFGRVGGMQS